MRDMPHSCEQCGRPITSESSIERGLCSACDPKSYRNNRDCGGSPAMVEAKRRREREPKRCMSCNRILHGKRSLERGLCGVCDQGGVLMTGRKMPASTVMELSKRGGMGTSEW